MTAFKRAKQYLSAAPRNLGTHIERYGEGAFIGGITMLGITMLAPVVVGMFCGGAAAVVFGQTDNYGSTQGAWAGVVAAILYALYRTPQNIHSHESVDATTVATELLLGLVGVLSLALAFIVVGILGGYIGHGIRRYTGSETGRPA